MLDAEDSMRVEYGATEAVVCGDTCGPCADCGRAHDHAEALAKMRGQEIHAVVRRPTAEKPLRVVVLCATCALV